MSIRFFITKDFIKDCMNPNKTVYLFGGKFNSPTVGSVINIVDKDDPNSVKVEEPVNPYDATLGNLGDYNKSWYQVDTTGSLSSITINDLINGGVLPCTINNDRTKVHVKIPYYKGLSDQLIGYLTYFTQPDSADDVLVGTDSLGNQNTSIPKEFKNLTERVGFVFESKLNNIGIVRSTENPNDSNSFIDIDLSKLNISADLQPIRYTVVKQSEGNFTWKDYEIEHLHNLVNTSSDNTGLSDNGRPENVTKSFIDTKSLKDNTRNQATLARNTYVPNIVSKLTENENSINDSYLITKDGRYINSDSDANNEESFIPLYVHKKKGLLSIPKFSLDIKDENGNHVRDEIVEPTESTVLLVSGFNPSVEIIENEDGTTTEIVSPYPDKFDHAVFVSNSSETVKYRLSNLNPYDIINI